MRELTKRFCLYGHTTGFHAKTKKLEPPDKIPSFNLSEGERVNFEIVPIRLVPGYVLEIDQR